MLIKFQCIHERESKSTHFRNFAKFIFEIVFLHEKHQWIKNIAKFFSNFFKVINYHEESRSKNTINVLTKRHEIFRSDLNVIARIIVISTSHTWNKRHDLQERNEFKKRNSNISWFHNLTSLFDNEFIDEVHVIKNISVEITIVMFWFEIVFWILIIDIMFANDIRNFKKFMKLLQHMKAEEWWKDDHLKTLNVNAINNNLYIFFDDHFEIKLRLIDETIETFIINSSVDVIEKKRLLTKMYEQIFFKRTHVFRMSFDSFTIIEKHFLRVQSTTIKCQLIENEYVVYKIKTNILLKTLIQSEIDQRKSKWSIVVERKLNMIIVWSNFLIFEDEDFNFKTTQLKKWFFQSNFVMKWMKILHFETSNSKFTRKNILNRLCENNFKLRKLLMKLKFEICLSVFVCKFFFTFSFIFIC